MLREVVDTKFNKNAARAAKSVGLDQPQFFAILNGQRSMLQAKTFEALERLLPSIRRPLLGAFVSPTGEEGVNAYLQWVGEARRSLMAGRPYWLRNGERWFLRVRAPRGYSRKLAAADALIAEIDRTPAFSAHLNDLRKVGRSNGHPNERIKLAEYRVVEPLLAAPESYYVERAWAELSDGEKSRYLRSSCKREEILLRRPNELQRVQEFEHLSRSAFLKVKGNWKYRPAQLASDAFDSEMRTPENLRRLGLTREPKKPGLARRR